MTFTRVNPKSISLEAPASRPYSQHTILVVESVNSLLVQLRLAGFFSRTLYPSSLYVSLGLFLCLTLWFFCSTRWTFYRYPCVSTHMCWRDVSFASVEFFLSDSWSRDSMLATFTIYFSFCDFSFLLLSFLPNLLFYFIFSLLPFWSSLCVDLIILLLPSQSPLLEPFFLSSLLILLSLKFSIPRGPNLLFYADSKLFLFISFYV